MRSRWLVGWMWAVFLSMPVVSAQTPSPEPDSARIDPFAEQIIGDAAAYLTSAKAIRVKAEISADRLLDSGHKIQHSRTVEIWLRRPDRLRAEIRSDDGRRRIFYDGETFSLQHLEQNVFSIIDVPDNIDERAIFATTWATVAELDGRRVKVHELRKGDRVSVIFHLEHGFRVADTIRARRAADP